MVVGHILKALRREAARLAALGTDRLYLASRKAKKDVTISQRFERAILNELRVKAAIALLSGAAKIELSDTLDGQEFRDLTIHVDIEQWEDVRPGTPPIRELKAPAFGSFA